MKQLLSALIAATMVASCSYAPAFAAPKEASIGIAVSKSICEMNAELAESMMELYQLGVHFVKSWGLDNQSKVLLLTILKPTNT